MSKVVALREDYDVASMRSLVRRSKHAAQSRRPLAFAAIYDGTRRGEDAARATADLRTRSAWICRAICPAQGKWATRVLS